MGTDGIQSGWTATVTGFQGHLELTDKPRLSSDDAKLLTLTILPCWVFFFRTWASRRWRANSEFRPKPQTVNDCEHTCLRHQW